MSNDNIERLPTAYASSVPAIYNGNRQLSTNVNLSLPDDDVIDTGRIWRVIRRYKKVILSLTGLFGLLAIVYSLALRPMYTATAIVRVNQNTSIVSVGSDISGAIGSPLGGGGGVNYKAAATAIKLIGGGGVGERVVVDANLLQEAEFAGVLTQRTIIPSPNRIIAGLKSILSGGVRPAMADSDRLSLATAIYKKNINVEEIPKTNLVRLTYTSFKPETAARVANSIVDAFNLVESESQQALAKSAQDVLQLELEGIQQKLQLSERKLTQFSRKTGIVDLEDSNSLMSNQTASMNESLIAIQRERRDLGVLILNAKNADDRSALSRILSNEQILALEIELSSLRSEYQQISAVFKEDYPKLKSIRERMSSLKADIDNEVETAINTMIAKYKILTNREESLKVDLSKSNADLLDLKDRSVALNILKREWESNKNLYQGLLEKVKRAGLAANLEMNRLSLLEAAPVPAGKSFPNIPKNVSIALLMGSLLGLAIAFVLALRDRKFRSIRELESYSSLPILTVIPKIENDKEGVDVTRAEVALASSLEPSGSMAETFRSFRTSLDYSMPDEVIDTVMITSSGPSEGKTSSLVNLATAIASKDKRVLLVDFDLRKPSLHKIFNVKRSPGLADSLINGVVAIKNTNIENLFVLPAGTSCPNPTEILESVQCRKMIAKLKEDFDVLLFDSPPVMGLADALVLSQYTKVLALAVDLSQTNKDALKSTINRLHRVNAPITGIILTKHSVDQTDDYGYEEGYYYYYNEAAYRYGDEPINRIGGNSAVTERVKKKFS